MPRPDFSKQAAPPQSAPASALDSQYSDASSTYWPPGWSFAKFRAATSEDLVALPADELAKMQAGLRQVLGEDGVSRLAQQLFQEEQQKKLKVEDEGGSLSSSHKPIAPNWLKHWSQRRKGQVWGFVCFRATGETRWKAFEEEVRRIIDVQFESAAALEFSDYEDARAKFEIRWIEDDRASTADADVLRKRYAEMRPDLPSGLAQELFLCATPEAVDSVLTPDAADRPTADSKWWRADAPFLVAVAADSDPGLEEGHEERDWFRPRFKVAAETLVEELWWLLDSDIMPLRRITRYTRGLGGQAETDGDDLDEIWWTTSPSPERLKKRRRFRGY
ncbi:hypothetical protein K449DRAFT_387887 [Hypoxylon sp. EC38]|nr:hypothetical protein K449DRAFT_387887 [Hypoxylon sp. EC38]